VVIAANDTVKESPQLLNQDPYGRGWLIKAKVDNPTAESQWMSNHDYREFLATMIDL
jgi:glycine cleavage system H protein